MIIVFRCYLDFYLDNGCFLGLVVSRFSEYVLGGFFFGGRDFGGRVRVD